MSAFMVNPAPPTSSKNLDARAQAQKSILRAKDSLVEEKTAENLAPDASGECKSIKQVKGGVDVATPSEVEEQTEWHPVCHPRLPSTAPPCYFVNKQAVIRSNATREFKLMKPFKSKIAVYNLLIGEKQYTSFKLEEIMVYTFWEQAFDSSVHYIYHKDGMKENCAWDNLIVCDLPTLQQLEIARLEKLHPGTKYTVVRNVHNTLTFERYLVSDTGSVYSLIRLKHIRPTIHNSMYDRVKVYCDVNAIQTEPKQSPILVHKAVMHSFNGPCTNEDLYVAHKNEDRRDNSLKNLAYLTMSQTVRQAFQPKQKAARALRTAQEKMPVFEVRPLPPVTKETQWMPVGVLPWDGRSFSKYEVSDAGHVRNIDNGILLKLSCGSQERRFANLYRDDPNMVGDSLVSKKSNRCRVSVSRLVANAFVDGYSETQNVVKHLNGDKQDNSAQNLKWLSRSSTSLNGLARRVVATPIDDPDLRKEFPTLKQAQRNLGTSLAKSKSGMVFRKVVSWEGEKRLVSIQVF